MANDITKLQGARQVGIAPPPEVKKLVDAFFGAITREHRGDALPRLPTPGERTTLDGRRKDIVSLLRGHQYSGAAADRARAALNALFGSYFNHRATTEDVEGLLTLMRERPAWAIEQTCQDVFDGKIFDVVRGERVKLNPDFLPSGPRLNQHALDLCGELDAEQFKIERVLAVKIVASPALREAPTEEQRQVVRNALQSFHGRVVGAEHLEEQLNQRRQETRTDMARASAAAYERDALREYEALGVEPVRNKDGSIVSVSMARSLGKLKVSESGRAKRKRRERDDGKLRA